MTIVAQQALGQGTIYTFRTSETADKVARSIGKRNIPVGMFKADAGSFPHGLATGMLGTELVAVQEALADKPDALRYLNRELVQKAAFNIYA